MKKLDWPLMQNNISKEDLNSVVKFLKERDDPILTQAKFVRKFENRWSKWLGIKYSVLVNSGSSANLLSILAVR